MRLIWVVLFLCAGNAVLGSPARGHPFVRLDIDNDGFLILKELFRLHYWHNEISKVYFAEIDENDDEKLSRAEFVDYRNKWANQEVAKAKKRSQYLAQKAIEKYGLPASGLLGQEEIKKYFEEEKLEYLEVVPRVLELFDKDGNELWSAEELEEFFYFYLPPKRHVENPDETFSRIDKDGDGFIDYEDYLRRDPMYEKEIKQIFDKMNTNDDEYVSHDEFDVLELKQIII
ncbi:hypothetical protein L596_022341 [Steinernema carpocapsae]|uniref:EF-hand domain-containing protein n=1 Tax=Steinernema carpocapsae TaxID=34508 RepID=A0A4U5MLG5_STECR|nr:hypothetical protein L596_022341 [Steinernema carpocapsae]